MSSRCQPDPAQPDFHFNPLSCPLPQAPNLKMFCIYGMDIPTERSYQYEHYQTREVRIAPLPLFPSERACDMIILAALCNIRCPQCISSLVLLVQLIFQPHCQCFFRETGAGS